MYVYYTVGGHMHGDPECGQMRGEGYPVMCDEPRDICHYCGDRARRLGFVERMRLLFG